MRIGNFELMPYAVSTNYIGISNPVFPEVQFKSDTHYGVAFSYAMALTAKLNLGLTVRAAERQLYQGDIGFSDLLKFVDSSNFQLSDLVQQRQGTTIGADIGLIYQADANWRFGLLAENVGYAAALGTATDAPPPEQQRIDFGMSYRVDWKPWRWDFMVDGQDLTNPDNLEVLRLLHVGTEIGRSYISRDNDIGLDAGINEGYFTMGGFFDIVLARLTLSYYAVELGDFPGQSKDRRWAATLLSSTTF
jgi:hypothetical protein